VRYRACPCSFRSMIDYRSPSILLQSLARGVIVDSKEVVPFLSMPSRLRLVGLYYVTLADYYFALWRGSTVHLIAEELSALATTAVSGSFATAAHCMGR
jgi:hypothetical protein